MSVDHGCCHHATVLVYGFVRVVTLVVSVVAALTCMGVGVCKAHMPLVLRQCISLLATCTGSQLGWSKTLDIASVVRWHRPFICLGSPVACTYSYSICFREAIWLVILHRIQSAA